MDSCAQTNAQLYLQIIERGCSPAELCLVRDAYGLAMQLYTGIFTGSGKPTLAHDVGTASLAHRHGGSFDLIAAGMLHSAYSSGNWGHYRKGVTGEMRKTLQEVIGLQAESYVYGLTMLPWDRRSIAALAERPEPFSQFERNVVFVRLVEELDRLLEYGAILCFRKVDKVKAMWREQRPHFSRLAQRIGHPQLAADLERAIDLTLTTELPAELLGLEFPGDSAPLVIPRSCQKRPLLNLSQTLSRAATRVSDGVRRRLQSVGRPS